MSSSLVFNRVYGLEIQSVMLVSSTPLVNCCPSTFSLTSPTPPPPPSQSKRTAYTDSVWLWGGGGVLSCVVDQILPEFNTLFLTRFRTYKIATPPQTKMTSRDDIWGLVSLKFLRPWSTATASLLDEQELHLPVWPAGQAEGGRQLRHQGLLPGDIQWEGKFRLALA